MVEGATVPMAIGASTKKVQRQVRCAYSAKSAPITGPISRPTTHERPRHPETMETSAGRQSERIYCCVLYRPPPCQWFVFCKATFF
jgi:hypothetical protein